MGEYVFQVATDEELVVEDGFDATVGAGFFPMSSFNRVVNSLTYPSPQICAKAGIFSHAVELDTSLRGMQG